MAASEWRTSDVSIDRSNVPGGSMKFARFFLILITLAVSPIAFGKARIFITNHRRAGIPGRAIAQRAPGRWKRKLPPIHFRPIFTRRQKLSAAHRFRFNIISFFYGLLILWIICTGSSGEISRHRRKSIIQSFRSGSRFRAALSLDDRDPAIASRRLRALGVAIVWHLGGALGRLVSGSCQGATPLDRGRHFSLCRICSRDQAQSAALVVLFLANLDADCRVPTFLKPFVIDPLFYTFEPLSRKIPALTQIGNGSACGITFRPSACSGWGQAKKRMR